MNKARSCKLPCDETNARVDASREHGLSMVETAGVLLVAMTLVLGVAGLADYIQTLHAVGYAVERSISDEGIKTLVADSSGVRFNSVGLSSAADRIANALASAGERLGGANGYRVELRVGEVSIDKRFGAPLGVNIPTQLRISRGSLEVPTSYSQKIDFAAEFEKRSAPIEGRSPLATPSGVFGTGHSDQFLPGAVVVGAQLYVAIAPGLTRSVVTSLGVLDTPIITDWVVAPLRGEVEAR